MDAVTSETSSVEHNKIAESSKLASIPPPLLRKERHCFGNGSPGEFLFSTKPSIVLHVLTSCNISPQDLVKLEATCSFFRRPANFAPDYDLSIAELASLDMCEKRAIFKTMSVEQRQDLKQRCGGSWKLVLKFLLAGETCLRRGKCQAIAGPGNSIVVTSKGAVYSFGLNGWGQLGHGTTEDEPRPRLISYLQGIRIVHATTGLGRTILVSETGRVYGFGSEGNKLMAIPRVSESLKDTFVVQVVIGNFFIAVLSREGRVYTFSWGDDEKLGHKTDANDVEPRPLLGALKNIPVVQIAAGHCYLVALACESGRMSVYSVGCGLGGKLGNGSTTDEKQPKLIEMFPTLNFEPVAIAAGSWHAAVIGKDGRVCTWGWNRYGCLGYGNQEYESVPKVVEAFSNVKAVHVAAGTYTTFVVSDNGDVYSFGWNSSYSLGHDYVALNGGGGADGDVDGDNDNDEENGRVVSSMLVTSLKGANDKVVHISTTNSLNWSAHTFALTESDKLYAFGYNNTGQLGVELEADQIMTADAKRVNIDLS